MKEQKHCHEDKMEMVPGKRGFVGATMRDPGKEKKPPEEHYHNPHARKFMEKVE